MGVDPGEEALTLFTGQAKLEPAAFEHHRVLAEKALAALRDQV